MKVFYTFGSDDRFPFCGGWVEVEAPSMKEAHAIFRANYPDRQPGILNCSDYYTEATSPTQSIWHRRSLSNSAFNKFHIITPP